MHIIIVIINVECNNILMHESREWTKTLSSRPSTQNKSFHVFIFLEFGVFGRQRLGRSEGSNCQKSGKQRQINTRQFHTIRGYNRPQIHQPIRSLRTKYSSVAPAITCRKPRNHWTKINLHTSAGTP